MKFRPFLLALFVALLLPQTSLAADCFADYKAKQGNPMRLHYGVAQISQCSRGAAKSELSARLAAKGWTLLNILSVFDSSGLAERKKSAGPNYLRF